MNIQIEDPWRIRYEEWKGRSEQQNSIMERTFRDAFLLARVMPSAHLQTELDKYMEKNGTKLPALPDLADFTD